MSISKNKSWYTVDLYKTKTTEDFLDHIKAMIDKHEEILKFLHGKGLKRYSDYKSSNRSLTESLVFKFKDINVATLVKLRFM